MTHNGHVMADGTAHSHAKPFVASTACVIPQSVVSEGQMWPRVNAVATQRFHEFADPLIQQSKPSWVYQVEMQK